MPKTRRGKRTSRATKKPTAPARTSKTLDAVSEAQTTAASLTESEKTAPHAPDPSLGPRTKGDVDSSHSLSSILSGIEDCEAMQLSREFRKLCSQHANPSYAASMAQYMRNQFSFFGIKAPERRRLQKQFTSTHKDKLTSRPFLLQFTVSLWQLDERECQLYGVDLASEFRKEMLGETRAEYEEAVACMESLLTTKSWWDTVDLLASQMVGYIVSQRPEWGVALMEQWIGHSCMWLRRTALLHQLNYKADTDKGRLFNFCLSVAQEEEFFVRKAIGWALRQYSRTDPAAVKEFVDKNRDKLSTLSVREALKHI